MSMQNTQRRGYLTEHDTKTEAEAIRDSLEDYHDGKRGLTAYRVDYSNEEDFLRFMELLTRYARVNLDNDDTGDQIKGLLDWNVQDNKTEFEGATINEVRRHFNRWVDSVSGFRPAPCYSICIYADAESIDSVLSDPIPGTNDPRNIGLPTTFVKLIDGRRSEEIERLEPTEMPDEEARAKINSGDEGFPPVDGCRRENVGWMKVAIRDLIMTIYDQFRKNGWADIYQRPPKVSWY